EELRRDRDEDVRGEAGGGELVRSSAGRRGRGAVDAKAGERPAARAARVRSGGDDRDEAADGEGAREGEEGGAGDEGSGDRAGGDRGRGDRDVLRHEDAGAGGGGDRHG